MIELLEENPKISKIKMYVTTALILFITFAIPVTITQVFRSNSITSSAFDPTPTKSIQSFLVTNTISNTVVTPTLFITTAPVIHDKQTNQFNDFLNLYFYPYWYIYAGLLVLILVWIGLITFYFMDKKKSVE